MCNGCATKEPAGWSAWWSKSNSSILIRRRHTAAHPMIHCCNDSIIMVLMVEATNLMMMMMMMMTFSFQRVKLFFGNSWFCFHEQKKWNRKGVVQKLENHGIIVFGDPTITWNCWWLLLHPWIDNSSSHMHTFTNTAETTSNRRATNKKKSLEQQWLEQLFDHVSLCLWHYLVPAVFQRRRLSTLSHWPTIQNWSFSSR